MASANSCGLILLGNSGVGKSFLANQILDDDQAFESRFSARSVTRHTEWKNMSKYIGEYMYYVANIPGLVEANQKLIDENRNEIMKAFEQCPLAIVIFVFGHKNGRIPDEDLVAFMKINEAYEFPPKSLALIVNGIPVDRPNDYEKNTTQLLCELLPVDKDHICFIEKASSQESKRFIHDILYKVIAKCQPVYHQKKHDIELIAEEISRLKKESQQRQDQLSAQEHEHSKRQQEYPSSSPSIHTHIPNPKTKATSESSNSNRHPPNSMNIIPARCVRSQSYTERRQHDSESEDILRLARQLEDDSKKTSAFVNQMLPSPQPSVIIIQKKKSGGPLKSIKKKFNNLLEGPDNSTSRSEQDDRQHSATLHNTNEDNSYPLSDPNANHLTSTCDDIKLNYRKP